MNYGIGVKNVNMVDMLNILWIGLEIIMNVQLISVVVCVIYYYNFIFIN